MVTVEVRPELARFVEIMEQRLRHNDWKPGWKNDEAIALYDRLTEEKVELMHILVHWMNGTADRSDIVWEAADVANFAMMIADVVGGL